MKLSIDRLLVSDASLRRRDQGVFSSHTRTQQDGFVFASAPESPAANRYRELCANLFGGNAPNKILLVTSAQARDGKTITAVNLAFAAAELGKPVLLIELSFNRPRFRVLFGAPPHHPGVERALRGEAHPEEIVGELGNTGISLAGVSESLPMSIELLEPGRHLTELLEYSKLHFACTILDGPEVAGSPYMAALTERTDEVLLVVRSGKTRTKSFEKAIRVLGPKQFSVVMNDLD